MNLLVITQKVDKDDPVLGFFHNWLLKFSPNFKKITVVCLQKGAFQLPQNIEIFSLGKESGENKFKYVFNFYKYIFRELGQYNKVFVHMNQEYVLLGGLFWKFFGKQVYMWRNHPKGNFLTRIAILLSEKVFCTSFYSFTAKFKKTILMPVGIDTNMFNSEARGNSSSPEDISRILSLGRISPIKNIDKMIDLAEDLDKKGINFRLNIVGDPVNKGDYDYKEKLVLRSKQLADKGRINFIKAVSQNEVVTLYQNHNIFLNLTPSGSLDKTILEAVSCGCVPIVINETFADIFNPNMVASDSREDILNKTIFWLNGSSVMIKEESDKLQKYVLENHSLDALIKKIVTEIS